jgi:hypothetical protein
MVKGGRCKHEVGMRMYARSFARLPSTTAFEQDVFRYRPQCQRQPVIQLRAPRRIFLKVAAKTYFGDVHDADISWLSG